ncbi:MAG: mechanosensitive ion channel, partial [Myxococcales bacterium]|nr:mechanosensitive ion channel [Myxococcales bacterium]
DNAMVVGQRILLAVLLFIAGWFVAKVAAYGVYRVLCSTSIDNKIAKKLRLSLLVDDKGGGEGEDAAADGLERFLSSVVYYLLMLLVIVGVLEYAGLSQAAGPIQGLVDTVIQALPLVGKAIAILVVAYFAGTLLSKLISRGLKLLKVDARFAELNDQEDDAERKPFSEHVGSVVFALIMIVGLSGAFEALQISAIAQPLHNAIDRLIGVVPSVAFAGLILFAGYILGRVVRSVLANVLDSLGLNRLVERVGLSKIFGKAKASWVVGTSVMAFIIIQAAIAAFNEVGLVTLSEPLTEMMARFWLILPSLAVSTVVVAVAVFAGRILRGVVAGGLRNLGFDGLMAKLGFAKIAEREDRLGEPSELVGFLVQAGIILLAVAQALANLHLDTWALYVNAFLAYLVKHVIVALGIVVIGLGIGGYVRDVIEARQASEGDEGSDAQRWLPEFARYVVLVFAFTMAVRQLEVAEDFVLLTFGLLFGSLCLAVAIAFGVGARGVAGEIVRKRYEEMQDKSGPGRAGGSSSAGRSGLFNRPDR